MHDALRSRPKKKIFIWNNEISPYRQDFHAKKKTDWHLKPFLSNQMSKIGLVLWEYLFWRDDYPVILCSTLLPLEDIFANNRLSRDSVTSHCFTYHRPGELDDTFLILILHNYSIRFFWSEPGVTPNTGYAPRSVWTTHLAPKSHLVSGKEMVFF